MATCPVSNISRTTKHQLLQLPTRNCNVCRLSPWGSVLLLSTTVLCILLRTKATAAFSYLAILAAVFIYDNLSFIGLWCHYPAVFFLIKEMIEGQRKGILRQQNKFFVTKNTSRCLYFSISDVRYNPS